MIRGITISFTTLLVLLSLVSFGNDVDQIIRTELDSIQSLLKDHKETAYKRIQEIDPSDITDNILKADYFLTRGFLNRHVKNRLAQALKDYNRCIYLIRTSREKDYHLLFSAINNKGGVLRKFKHYERAIENYGEGLDILDKPGIKEPIKQRARILYNIGKCYFHWGKLNDAKYSFEQSNLVIPRTRNLIYIARCYSDNAQYEKAEEYFKNITDTTESNHYKAQALHNLGDIYLQTKDTITALEYFSQSLTLKTGSSRFITLLDIGSSILTRDPEKAKQILIEATEYLNSIPNTPENLMVYSFLHKAEKKLKSYNDKYLELYAKGLEAHNESQDASKIAEGKLKVDLIEMELERDFAIYKTNKNLQIGGLVVGLIVLILLISLGYKKYKKHRLISSLRSHKNRG